MKIPTGRFGEIDIPDERVIQFIEPILGFEESQSYVLLDHAPDSPFRWLQSVQESELAFVVTIPQLFNIDYEVTLSDEIMTKLSIQEADDVMVLNIVNIPAEDPTEMTANLLGPVVINQRIAKAMQVVLHDSNYSTKVRLLASPKSGAGSSKTENETETNEGERSSGTVVAFPNASTDGEG